VIAALRYETVRITTVRSTILSIGFALLIGLGLGWLVSEPLVLEYDQLGNPIGEPVIDWYGAFGTPLALSAVFAAVIASQSIGQEYRFGLIRLTLTAFPKRVQILVAKLLVVVAGAAVVALASYVGSWIAVTLRGSPLPGSVEAPDSTYLVRGVVYVALVALSAFALAGITRQTAVGIAIPIISGLIVEQILGAVLTGRADWLVRILPWSTGARWSQTPPESVPGGVLELDFYAGWQALAVLGVWVVVLLAVQAALFIRRDA
jgi:ABC-2 type transport system permease protein